MSTIDEMLNEQMETDVKENPVCVIDRFTREIIMHEECKFFGVENDKKVERIKFKCPIEVGDENLNLMTCKSLIAYVNANGESGLYEIQDMEQDGDYVHFSWLFDEDVTKYKGDVEFIFYASKLDEDEVETAWNTIPAQGFVERGLPAVAGVEKKNPSIIEAMLLRISKLEKSGPQQGSTVNVQAFTLLVEILQEALYGSDQSAKIQSFAQMLLYGNEDEPSTPDVPDEPVAAPVLTAALGAARLGCVRLGVSYSV